MQKEYTCLGTSSPSSSGACALKTICHTIDFGDPLGKEDFHLYRRYEDLRPLGSGAFGILVSAIDTQASRECDDTGQDDTTSAEVVVKKLPKIFKSSNLTKAGLREIMLLKFFAHDNILNLRDIILPLGEDSSGSLFYDQQHLEHHGLYLVFDRMDFDLSQVINDSIELNVDTRRFITYQILRGLKFIHSARVLHRDLKPQNILVNSFCDVKICDFGLAREYESLGMTTFVTTQLYRAPELLMEMSRGGVEEAASQNTIYTQAVDVWSVGCIMAEMLLRRPLFPCSTSSPASQIKTILEVLGQPTVTPDTTPEVAKFLASFGASCSPPARQWSEILPDAIVEADERDMAARMLVFDPAQRITVTEALPHPFLAMWRSEEDEPASPAVYNGTISDNPYFDLLALVAQQHPTLRSVRGWPSEALCRVGSPCSTKDGSPKASSLLGSPRSSLRHGKWGSVRESFAKNSSRRDPGWLFSPPSYHRGGSRRATSPGAVSEDGRLLTVTGAPSQRSWTQSDVSESGSLASPLTFPYCRSVLTNPSSPTEKENTRARKLFISPSPSPPQLLSRPRPMSSPQNAWRGLFDPSQPEIRSVLSLPIPCLQARPLDAQAQLQ